MATGKPISLSIQFKNVALDKNSKPETLSGKIPLILPSGGYKIPKDAKASSAAAPAWLKDWLRESGIITENTPEGKAESILAKAKQFCIGSQFLIPTLDPANEKLGLFMKYFTLSNIIQTVLTGDDGEENAEAKAKKKEMLTKDKALKIQGLLIAGEIIEGKLKDIDSLPKGIPIPPEYKLIIESFFNISQSARDLIFDFQNLSKPLATKSNESFTGLGIFVTQRFLENVPDIPETTFKYLHSIANGIEPLIEMSCLCAGISLAENVRDHVLFRKCFSLAGTITDYLIDVFNLGKAIRSAQAVAAKKAAGDDDPDMALPNIILYKMKVSKLSLAEAFAKHLEEIRDCVHNFKGMCSILRATNPKNKRMDKFLNVIENFIDGSVHWLSGSNNPDNKNDFTATISEN